MVCLSLTRQAASRFLCALSGSALTEGTSRLTQIPALPFLM